ncbi:MAG TPA: outer membrane beta-barrel protein [Usitatibacter sp.]|nr:outer membrane beta-barrel protein [Usitatibacter sp.]
MSIRARLVVLAIASAPIAAAAGDYVGTLKLPRSTLPAPGELYSFASIPSPSLSGTPSTDQPFRLKLGYRYSRFFSVEGEVNDMARTPANFFGAPASLASQFRSSGFGVDTVATLPVWGFSFYGKLGAYRGEPSYPFATYSTSLLGDVGMRTHWRYGLGVRYDFTKSLGVRAQVERYSPLGAPLATEPDADLFSIGVSWRF